MEELGLKLFKKKRVPKGAFTLMHRVYRYILPEVKQQLDSWRQVAENIPNSELRSQALASMRSKQFHCQGGAVYAAIRLEYRHILIPLIVALQTISDYLDNLCDRSTSMDPDDFRSLHQAMLDAVDPSARFHDYYQYRDDRDDGGYLKQLVSTCQSCVLMLPSYKQAQPYVEKLVSLYSDLQVYKHIDPKHREARLLSWWEKHRHQFPELKWNEFAAGTGSTLGMFMLFTMASYEEVPGREMELVKEAYFPNVCSLHILLDYLIDQEEDRIGGDLNFCHYYEDKDTALSRIHKIAEQAKEDVKQLKYPSFHRMIIDGLQGLYLSDPKVKEQQDVQWVSHYLMKKGTARQRFFWFNSVWIRKYFT